MDMNGKVVGAVVDSNCGRGCCPGRRYKDYFNFTNSVISIQLDEDRCGWLYGMNVFDLKAWRKTNITRIYHHWLKLVSIFFSQLVQCDAEAQLLKLHLITLWFSCLPACLLQLRNHQPIFFTIIPHLNLTSLLYFREIKNNSIMQVNHAN